MEFQNYTAIEQRLFQWLPAYQQQGKKAYKPGLKRIQALCEALHHPEKAFKGILITGTNGKGSVAFLLSKALQHLGFKTGLYTSPHLYHVGERIRIQDIPIAPETIAYFLKRYHQPIERIQPSFFEVMVAMAFWYFAECSVDWAVVEVGLGGRLDSTNVLPAYLSLLTRVAYDHQNLLGETLWAIAKEKVAIMKEKRPFLVGAFQPELHPLYWKVAQQKQAPLFYAQTILDLQPLKQTLEGSYYHGNLQGNPFSFFTSLIAPYQRENLRTVFAAMHLLSFPPEAFIEAFRYVASPYFVGRFQIWQKHPLVIADIAHNEEGIQTVLKTLNKIHGGALRVLWSCVKDKPWHQWIKYFPKDTLFYIASIPLIRSSTAEEIAAVLQRYQRPYYRFDTIEAAYEQMIKDLKEDEVGLITGSSFHISALYRYLLSKGSVPEGLVLSKKCLCLRTS